MANITSGGSNERVAKVETVRPTTASVPRSRAVITETAPASARPICRYASPEMGMVDCLWSAPQIPHTVRTDNPQEFLGLLNEPEGRATEKLELHCHVDVRGGIPVVQCSNLTLREPADLQRLGWNRHCGHGLGDSCDEAVIDLIQVRQADDCARKQLRGLECNASLFTQLANRSGL